MVQQQEQQQYSQRKQDSQLYIGGGHSKDAAEEVVHYIHIAAAAEGSGHHANGQRSAGNQRNGTIPGQTAAAAETQQEKRGQDNDRQGNGQWGSPQRHCHRHGAKAYMGKPIADHGIALEDQADP